MVPIIHRNSTKINRKRANFPRLEGRFALFLFIGSNLSFQQKEEIRTHPLQGRCSSDYPLLVRVGRLELPASCSQMCVGTFSRHSIALFGPFLCFGNFSLTLFRPACFKETFRLLGFVWDWILCIKRCSARFEGAMTGQSPQNRGAGNAPHKQRNTAHSQHSNYLAMNLRNL